MNNMRWAGIGLALSLVSSAAQAGVELPVKVLTLEVAQHISAAAKSEADKRGATVVIAVVDDGGQLILLERLNDTQVASVEVGIGKARTAAIFRRPSKVFEDQVRDGRVAAIALPGATPLHGGLPIEVDGEVIGAIGVSGNTPQEDEDIAKAGLKALESVDMASLESGASLETRYFSAARVADAFVHRSVPYPAASAPALRLAMSAARCAGSNLTGRPARAALRSPADPCASRMPAQRETDWRETPSLRATSACERPRPSMLAARLRRLCSASKSRLSAITDYPRTIEDTQIMGNVTVLFKSQ